MRRVGRLVREAGRLPEETGPARLLAAPLECQQQLGNRATAQLMRGGAPQQSVVQAKLKTDEVEDRDPPPDERRSSGALLAGVEALSGVSMADVRVRFDSGEPGRAGARAFTAGSEIHLGPGEEGSLAHEAWHVVQQKQGRVPAQAQFGGVGVNLDTSLEREADVMGARAQTRASALERLPTHERAAESRGALGHAPGAGGPAVRQFKTGSRGPRREAGRTYDQDIFTEQEADRGDLIDFEFPRYDDKGRRAVVEDSQIRHWIVRANDIVGYTARTRATARSIRAHGIDPTRGRVENPISTSQELSNGHIYFGRTMQIPKTYGNLNLGGDFVIIEFTLPVGAVVMEDPEIPNAMRSPTLVPNNLIRRFYDRRGNPLDPNDL